MRGKRQKVRDLLASLWQMLRRPWAWIPLLGLTALGSGFAIGTWKNICADCPSVAEIHTWEPQQTSKIFAHDGRVFDEIGLERRTAVVIADLPFHVPQAFLAVEDRRFYEHGAVDIRGITRAVFGVLTNISFEGGGASTITQQLARNMFVEEIGFDRSLKGVVIRKVRELQVALELERAYSKDEILEAYMNQVNFDRGNYGLETASRYYFSKRAVELNPAEAAMLAAIVRTPKYLNPFNYPENALQRRNLVLERMARENFLTEAEAEEWQNYPLPEPGEYTIEMEGEYVKEWVRQEVQERFPGRVNTDGLLIDTTLDIDMQRAAEVAMARGFPRIEGSPGYSHPTYDEYMEGNPAPEDDTPYVQGAMIVMEPGTGAVRALIGGRDYEHSRFDRARLALRQPGSSFKTFVYAAALERGIPPSSVFVDEPVEYPQGPGLELWSPRNFENEFEGPMTLRYAYQRSINTVAVQLANEIGMTPVVQMAQRLGIRSEIQPYLSTAIGASDVYPIQMSEAYSAIAALGRKVRPYVITRVRSADGDTLWEPEPEVSQVLDPVVARQMITMMETVVDGGTAAGAIRSAAGLPYEIPAAGKTGTTNEGRDIWFVGFTPNLQATVWFGMDRPRQIYRGVTSVQAATVWGEFMRLVYIGDLPAAEGIGEAIDGDRILPVPPRWSYEGLITRQVDRLTGLLASQWCPPADRGYTEYFIPGTEPTEVCDETVPRGPSGSIFPWIP